MDVPPIHSLSSDIYHTSVMTDELLFYLNPQPDKIYCDVTFGSGGHTQAILEREKQCRVVAMDWDAASIEKYAPHLEEKYQERFKMIWGNFAHIYRLLKKAKIEGVDGIIADFGTSYMHLKERPGFSLYLDSDLDMRMSPAHQQVTAKQVVNKATQEKLCEIFWQLGQEQHAKKIAYAIVQERHKKRIETTRQLALIVEKIVPYRQGKIRTHPATRIFQALRIYVNHELDNIHAFLSGAMKVLRPGGRIICITFHSLEDGLVKQFFKKQAEENKLVIVTKRVVVPTVREIALNPSARSAKMRVATVVT